MRDSFNTLPIGTLLPAMTRAEDMMARLDERALRHPAAEGFCERGHFFDSAAALWVGGELVHVEDLVLHDAHMDARAPTHELTIAHTILRTRRRLWHSEPDWWQSAAGFAALRSGMSGGEESAPRPVRSMENMAEPEDAEDGETDALGEAFAEIDAAIARSEKALAGERMAEARGAEVDPLGLIHDEDWDEAARMDAWRDVVHEADLLPPALAAAVLFDAWERIEPLRRQHWLGSLLVSAYLRGRGKVTSHFFALNVGLKAVRHERRRASERSVRLLAFLDAMAEAADAGLRELDRLLLAKMQMERRLKDRRSNSSLPGVIDLVLSRPIVSANMVARHVGITPRGALNLVSTLGLREMTGRGRYRGWGVL